MASSKTSLFVVLCGLIALLASFAHGDVMLSICEFSDDLRLVALDPLSGNFFAFDAFDADTLKILNASRPIGIHQGTDNKLYLALHPRGTELYAYVIRFDEYLNNKPVFSNNRTTSKYILSSRNSGLTGDCSNNNPLFYTTSQQGGYTQFSFAGEGSSKLTNIRLNSDSSLFTVAYDAPAKRLRSLSQGASQGFPEANNYIYDLEVDPATRTSKVRAQSNFLWTIQGIDDAEVTSTGKYYHAWAYRANSPPSNPMWNSGVAPELLELPGGGSRRAATASRPMTVEEIRASLPASLRDVPVHVADMSAFDTEPQQPATNTHEERDVTTLALNTQYLVTLDADTLRTVAIAYFPRPCVTLAHYVNPCTKKTLGTL